MIEIKDLLVRFNNLLNNEEVKVSVLKEVLFDFLKINIPKEKIIIKNNNLFLDIKPIYKNEIFLNKDKISFELEKRAGIKNFNKFY